MNRQAPDESTIWQRRLASQANNRAWTLSESLSRTQDEDEEMLHAAHEETTAHREHYAEAVRGIGGLEHEEDRILLSATLRVVPVPKDKSGAA